MRDDLVAAVEAGEINENSPIDVDILNGPIGGYGFRSGKWPVTIGGVRFKMYNSIPHQLDLTQQKNTLLESVKTRLANAIKGETYIDKHTGETHLKYASQMERII